MLKTFKHVGTYTPENIPSFSMPPMGRGPSPGFGVERSPPFAFLLSVALCICTVNESSPAGPVCVLLRPLADRFRASEDPPPPSGEGRCRSRLVREWSCGGGVEAFVSGSYGLGGARRPGGRALSLGEGDSSPSTEYRLFNSPASSLALRAWKFECECCRAEPLREGRPVSVILFWAQH
jgi:hypothetical protein